MASKAWLKFKSLQSEKIGALLSYAGTLGVSLSKDRDSFLATAICLAGESMFLVTKGNVRAAAENLKRGDFKPLLKGQWPEGLPHKPGDEKVLAETAAGYSASYVLFILSNYALLMSRTTAGNQPLRAVVFAMTASWALALSRYPVEKLAQKMEAKHPAWSERLHRFADNTPAMVSSSSAALRVPTLALALHGGNNIMAACTALWGGAELFMGRVPSKIIHGISALREKTSHFIWAEGPAASRSQQVVKQALRGTLHREPAPLPPQALAYWR